MKLATWNVNSLRARVDRVVDWLDVNDIDVLAMQETKCRDDEFPRDRFAELGYEVATNGISQWNGVAIASRVGIADVRDSFEGQPSFSTDVGDTLFDLGPPPLEARAIGAVCDGVTVWSIYVPNGRKLADPHYEYKLEWLAALRDNARAWVAEPTVIAGDWNIIPTDDDVWNIAKFIGKTHVSTPEREAFAEFLALGFADTARPFTHGTAGFTYWDYFRMRFEKDEGMRIDFVLASPEVAERVTNAHVDRDARKGKGASDHAPVVVDVR